MAAGTTAALAKAAKSDGTVTVTVAAAAEKTLIVSYQAETQGDICDLGADVATKDHISRTRIPRQEGQYVVSLKNEGGQGAW
jgi:hypothetical protein